MTPDTLKTHDRELTDLIRRVSEKAKQQFGRTDDPQVVVSPYRINPLGAHIDHQGGDVLARTVSQYTVLVFYPLDTPRIVLQRDDDSLDSIAAAFDIGHQQTDENWIRYAMASAQSLASMKTVSKGFTGLVHGSMVGAGLSSSASVILAYISALAHANSIELSNAQMVELARQVENDHMGLNNGIQDQMSVVFGRSQSLSLLHMDSVTTTYIENPANVDEVCWVICYSGFSRELVKSGFNDRVSECKSAAAALDPGANRLADVAVENRTANHLAALPPHLAKRAKHVYSEIERVKLGCTAWEQGNWVSFGKLMNESCHSSIHDYECGSEPMIQLQKIALDQVGVFGSRFSGGGYGGCLNMLVEAPKRHDIKRSVLEKFLTRFPEKKGVAKCFVATAEENVRLVPK